VHVLGGVTEFNQALEHAGRVADFLEFAELMCLDALERNESCGGHFRILQAEEVLVRLRDAYERATMPVSSASAEPRRNCPIPGLAMTPMSYCLKR
jgi:succinate dehydrogenase/fumarate reductase flavoprotein subunit